MRRIAFFGGSFDPPHRGHLAIATAAADRFALDQVLFAPVGRQPLKGRYPATEFLHRYAMTALATQSDPRFIPSLLDAPREPEDGEIRPNYTVDTLARLRDSLADAPGPSALFTLVGADSWLDIAHWHQAPRLLALTDWIVAARPGFSLASAEAALPQPMKVERVVRNIDNTGDNSSRLSLDLSTESELELHHTNGTVTRVWFLPNIHEDISATELRVALDQGWGEVAFLPPLVRDYITKTQIYRPRDLKSSLH